MSQILERIDSAREHVRPRWSPARERALRWRLENSLERRRVKQRVLAGMALVVALVVGHLGYSKWWNTAAEGAATAEERGKGLGSARPGASHVAIGVSSVQLEDGTVAQGMSEETRLEVAEESEHQVTMRLTSGQARFDVARRADRTFRVQARDVLVTVLGTQFTVELVGEKVRVLVDRGRVDVAWPGAHRVLGAGEEVTAGGVPATVEAAPAGELAPQPDLPATSDQAIDLDAADVPEASAPAAAPPHGAHSAPGAATPSPSSGVTNATSAGTSASNGVRGWRHLAQEGDYAGAFAALSREGAGGVRQEPGDLLFAADVARLSGHAAEALPHLQRVVRSYPGDSRAPLAAFTLGRILLDNLGRPREAAEAFARCRKLAPGGALSQDALAREVESWSRAGEAGFARDRATQYMRLFPGGRREKAVRYHGGLEGTE